MRVITHDGDYESCKKKREAVSCLDERGFSYTRCRITEAIAISGGRRYPMDMANHCSLDLHHQ